MTKQIIRCIATVSAVMFCISCVAQNEKEQYLKFKKIADQFQTYTVEMKSGAIMEDFSPKQLKKLFDRSFSFLKKKEEYGSIHSKNLAIRVSVDSPRLYSPVVVYTHDNQYKVTQGYSITVILEMLISPDSIVSIPLCVDKYFMLEQTMQLFQSKLQTDTITGSPKFISDGKNIFNNSFNPRPWQLREDFLAVLSYYRSEINAM